MQSNKCPDNVEELREMYRPEKIEVLLVGESPPGDRWKFFYCDNGSRLGYATMEAFEKAFQRKFESYKEFLDFFKSKNFYLEDLFHVRGKKVCEASLDEVQKALEGLTQFIALHRPRLVIAVLCRICGCVKKAAADAKLDISVICLPFPRKSSKNYQRYVKSLAKILQSLLSDSPIKIHVCCYDD